MRQKTILLFYLLASGLIMLHLSSQWHDCQQRQRPGTIPYRFVIGDRPSAEQQRQQQLDTMKQLADDFLETESDLLEYYQP